MHQPSEQLEVGGPEQEKSLKVSNGARYERIFAGGSLHGIAPAACCDCCLVANQVAPTNDTEALPRSSVY
jgi:hypothetical protein